MRAWPTALLLALLSCGDADEGGGEREARVPLAPYAEDVSPPGYVDFGSRRALAVLEGLDVETLGAWVSGDDERGARLALQLPVWEPGPHRLLLRGVAAPGGGADGGTVIAVRCGGTELGELVLGEQPRDLLLDVPERYLAQPATRIELTSDAALAGPLGGAGKLARLGDIALVPAEDDRALGVLARAHDGDRVEPGRGVAFPLGGQPWRRITVAARSADADRGALLLGRVLDSGGALLTEARFELGAAATRHELTPTGVADAARLELYVPYASALVVLEDLEVELGPRLSSVVLIVVDTLRADALGRGRTPNLDALATDGVRFARCFSHAPMTLPAHASLFSSRLPYESGALTNGDRVDPELPLLAERLRDAGFATAASVSIGALEAGPGRQLNRGFDWYSSSPWALSWADGAQRSILTALGELGAARPAFLFAHYSDPHEPFRDHTGDAALSISLDGALVGTASLSHAQQWGDAIQLTPGEHRFDLRASVPFSLRTFECRGLGVDIESSFDPADERANRRVTSTEITVRVPGDAPANAALRVWASDLASKADAVGRYRDEVAYVDRFIGALLDELRARGLYEDSLIVFTSDHGEALGEHDWMYHAENVYDELLHVPLVIKLPAGDGREELLARHRDRLVRHSDVAPTLLELLGLPGLPSQRG
ncbi:MAG: sulfatase, partial [Planctomycetota bacterium]